MRLYQRLTEILSLSGALLVIFLPGPALSQPSSGSEKSLPFPVISSGDVESLASVKHVHGRRFPSAIDIKGTSKGLLLHARKQTRYDLLSQVALWLESGPLLVSVRAPTQTALVANKFGDVCITTGGDALVERGEGYLRIDNLGGVGAGGDSVCLVLHDKAWKSSPWAHLARVDNLQKKGGKGKSKKEDGHIEQGVIAIAPGYELVLADHGLEISEIKPPDMIGRRDYKVFEGGRFAISEISVDSLVQQHDLVRNLKEHGEKANTVLSEIDRVAAQFKTRQGDEGFERVAPPPPPKPETVKKPDPRSKPSTKPPVAGGTKTPGTKPPDKPKGPQQAGSDIAPGPSPAPGGKSGSSQPPVATGGQNPPPTK